MVYIDYGANIFRKEALEMMISESQFYSLDELFPRLIEMDELLPSRLRNDFMK